MGLKKIERIPVKEADLQDAIIDIARVLGYRVAHFRPALTDKGWRTPVSGDGKGFPDLELAHAQKHRTLYIECKSEKGRLSPEQNRWLMVLALAGNECYIIKPSEWEYIKDVLLMSSAPTENQSRVQAQAQIIS